MKNNVIVLVCFRIVVFLLCLILALQSCTTAKRCAEKYPCTVVAADSNVVINTLPNPNAAVVDSLMRLIKPCPEWHGIELEPISSSGAGPVLIPNAIEDYNKKVQTVNDNNSKILNALQKPCKDSIHERVITKNFYLIDKAKDQQLKNYIDNDASWLWHLKRIFILKWYWFVIAVLAIVIYRNRFNILEKW